MFKRFKRKRETISVMPGVLERMTQLVNKRQRKAADYLNNKVSVFSTRQLKIFLFAFCVAFGTCAAYIIFKAIINPEKSIVIKPIQPSDHVILPRTNLRENPALSNPEIQNINEFQEYLNSLQKTSSGKKVYDSIARERPGLLDSLKLIQQLYKEQLKK